jgi:tetratricopeptide (TPR) repeat protein
MALPDAATATQGGTSASMPPVVPQRAAADFDRAVGLMRAGNASEAELEFKQLSLAYPQLTAPRVNLALLQRKAGRLDEAEATLKSAVESNSANAVAWNELGITLRMQGRFAESADAYEHAIAADPTLAAAHRNLAVLLDLYLGDAERALTELERYKELTGEEKPVNVWIAELRQRTGKLARPKSETTPPSGTTPEGTTPADAPPQPADAQPQAAPAPKSGEL